MRDAYLSVDLDYWMYSTSRSDCAEFFGRILRVKRPITVVTYHHSMLHDINRAKHYRLLYNVDFHSDISQPYPGWVNEGTWVNFVNWRRQAKFEWRYPNHTKCIKQGYGLCHSSNTWRSKDNPFKHLKLTNWNGVQAQKGLKEIRWSRIDRVGICLSPDWTTGWAVQDILRELKERGYLKNISRAGKRYLRDLHIL